MTFHCFSNKGNCIYNETGLLCGRYVNFCRGLNAMLLGFNLPDCNFNMTNILSIMASDINECSVSELATHHGKYRHNCHANANCTNTKGLFYCSCHTGYSGDGVQCVGMFYLYFSNSIIHQVKTKNIITVTMVLKGDLN